MEGKLSRTHALRDFFAKDSRPVEGTEFMSFYKSLSADERQSFAVAAAKQLGMELDTEVK